MSKPQLRRRFRDVRESLEQAHVANASSALCRRLAGMTLLQRADTILSYLAFRNEPDLGALFELLPDVHWVLPRIEGHKLILHRHEADRLVLHPYGILEPAADAPVVELQSVDLVLVPGVAFDRTGGRLGFGGGFYDRLLIRTSAERVGIVYDCCVAEELPCDEHDQRMDWVITPSQAIRCGPLWRQAVIGVS
jgi:5-formyltetrahydrofolate cyclo-ligase